MSEWVEVKAKFSNIPDDWSFATEIYGKYDITSTLVDDSSLSITGYLPKVSEFPVKLSKLKSDLLNAGACDIATANLDDEEWIELVRASFKPVRLGLNWYICPSWDQGEPKITDKMIILDPGQSFGTGDHPTTKLCLGYLEVIKVKEQDIADIGCGTGILSIAAKILGASNVIAVDTDAAAVQSARENAHVNNVSYEVLLGNGFRSLPSKAKYNLIFSNIISNVLIEIAPQAYERLYRNGIWMISGIIQDRWDEVSTRCKEVGFRIIDERKEGEWIAALLQK